MNPSASEWRPGFAAPPPPQIVSDPPPSSNNNANANDSEIDESDPLWKLEYYSFLRAQFIALIMIFRLSIAVYPAPTFFMHPLCFKYTNNTSLDHERFFIATKS